MATEVDIRSYERLPGADLVRDGIRDLEAGSETVPALAVSMAATRLRAVGLDLPPVIRGTPSHRLFELLAAEEPDAAHSQYNAIVARIVSFARAAEHARSR